MLKEHIDRIYWEPHVVATSYFFNLTNRCTFGLPIEFDSLGKTTIKFAQQKNADISREDKTGKSSDNIVQLSLAAYSSNANNTVAPHTTREAAFDPTA